MAEKLKVFQNRAITVADSGNSIEIINNNATTQAVVKNVNITSNASHKKDYALKVDGKEVASTEDNTEFNGSLILDNNEVFTIELTSEPEKMRTLYFINSANEVRRLYPRVETTSENFRVSYYLDSETALFNLGFSPTNNSFKAYKNLSGQTIIIAASSNIIKRYNVATDTLEQWTDGTNIYETIDYNESDGYIYYTKEGGYTFGRVLESTMTVDATWSVALDDTDYSMSGDSDLQATGDYLWILPKAAGYTYSYNRIVKVDISAKTYEYKNWMTCWASHPIGCTVKEIDGVAHLITPNTYTSSPYAYQNSNSIGDIGLRNRILCRNLENGEFVAYGSDVTNSTQYQQDKNKNRSVLLSDNVFMAIYYTYSDYDCFVETLDFINNEQSYSQVFNSVSNPDIATSAYAPIDALVTPNYSLYFSAFNIASVFEGINYDEKFDTTTIRVSGVEITE